MSNDELSSQRGKAALVLAGGGVTGAVYEIGALCALDDMLGNLRANDFDLYIGTSAGALVASCLANGLTPREMLQHLDTPLDDVAPLRLGDLLALHHDGLLQRGLHIPQALAQATAALLASPDHSLLDAIAALAMVVPSGLYDAAALERYLGAVFARPGRSNDFRALRRALAIIATDLDTGERAVFGAPPLDDVPIARAVAASSAVPLVYRPVRIDGHDYVDGGIRGTASLDLAIEQGARLIVCINPQVALDARRAAAGHISDLGAPGVANQVFRTFVHAGLHYHAKQLRRYHSQVDILLIEPSRDDLRMFFEMPMHYATRLEIAQHSVTTVSRHLAEHYEEYRAAFARHSVEMHRPVAPLPPAPMARNGGAAHGSRQLRATLAQLEVLLEQF